jgi:hypothetical protein
MGGGGLALLDAGVPSESEPLHPHNARVAPATAPANNKLRVITIAPGINKEKIKKTARRMPAAYSLWMTDLFC